MNGWLETYRGIVYRWEVDHNDHLTVAFYFARLGDATLTLLDALGLGREYTRRRGNLCLTADCYVRYVRELRVGDIMHVLVNEASPTVPDAPRWFNRVLAARQYTISAGTSEIQRNIIGERVLGLPRG